MSTQLKKAVEEVDNLEAQLKELSQQPNGIGLAAWQAGVFSSV